MDRDEMMERVAAARCYANTANNAAHQARIEMAAFLDIFHPDLADDLKAEMIRDAAEQNKDRT